MIARLHPACTIVLWLALCTALALAPQAAGGPDDHGADSDEADRGIHAPGPAVSTPRTTQRYTAPGMTLNPVAIDIDPKGNIYVVEGWRHGKGAVAVVSGPMWRSGALALDLQRTTIEQRAEHIESLIERGVYTREFFTSASDRIRLVKDTDHDGTADRSTVFAGGFNDKLEGVASGVLYHDGTLYFANIPHLWRLEDKDGDGDADQQTPGERTSMSYGYGLRWAYGGHDLHGLIKGPDGRIYFTIGDRGYNVQTQEGERLIGLNVGSVLRMWPDGSGLEVYATGLRNPQELAFDNYGNLFTGENNCDAGDLARFCFLPEGSDAGWRQDVQTLDHRGPWMRERMWEPRLAKDDPTQPAWILPPLANVGRGPSGIAHYPGTGDNFPANGSFLVCDYPAGVRHVQLKPDGASFKVVEDSALSTPTMTISDLAWGYDGRLYLADWGQGWSPNDKGHLQVMVNQAAHQDQAEAIAEVKALFAEGFETLSDEALIELLGHRDQRVRSNAQWEAAGRAIEPLLSNLITDKRASELSRLHAVWTLGMMARHTLDYAVYIEQALNDANPNIRAQAIKTLGELDFVRDDQAVAMLSDSSPIIQHHAAIALGKTGTANDIPALLDLLERNDNNDAVLRHAASYALSLIGDAEAIHDETKGRGPAARLGAVLALRRLSSPLLAEYLDDEDVLVAAEAVRAIYDQRVMDVLPDLAALCDTLAADRMFEGIMRRVIEANVRLADADSAARLARLAANPDAPEPWRLLALDELDQWASERNRDGVWGSWWPRPGQPMDEALAALRASLPAIIAQPPGATRTRARILQLARLDPPKPDRLAEIAADASEPGDLRFFAIRNLSQTDTPRAIALAADAAASAGSPVGLRESLRELLLRLDPAQAMDSYLFAVREGEITERQQAVRELSRMDDPRARDLIAALAADLERGRLPRAIRYDVYKAALDNTRLPPAARAAAANYAKTNTIAGEEPFIRDALVQGGSADRGEWLFYKHPTAQCIRCHTVGGLGSVGPDLGALGKVHNAEYLYTALVNPHADIADGYANTTVRLTNGSVLTGRLVQSKSTPAKIVLANADGVEQTIPRDQVRGLPITSDRSLMPTMTDKLNPEELRDVLAFLGSLKGDGTTPPGHSAAHAGPSIVSPGKDLPHYIYLPLMLMGIFALLGLLLLITVLAGERRAADSA